MSFIRRFNLKARQFNTLLRDYCRHSWLVNFLDHGFYYLPASRVLAADGVHLSFEGTAIFASHLRQLLITRSSDTTTSWRTCTPNAPHAPLKESSVHDDSPATDLLPSRHDSTAWPALNGPSSQRISGPCDPDNQFKASRCSTTPQQRSGPNTGEPSTHVVPSEATVVVPTLNGLPAVVSTSTCLARSGSPTCHRPSDLRSSTPPSRSVTSNDELQPAPAAVRSPSTNINPAAEASSNQTPIPQVHATPLATLQPTTDDSSSIPPHLQQPTNIPCQTVGASTSSAPTQQVTHYNLRTQRSHGPRKSEK